MHIAEGYLPVTHAVAWTAVSAPFVIHGGYAVMKRIKEHPEDRLLLGAAGAFTFVMSAIKIPSITGSSSHPTGTALGAILFRPPVMALLGTITLLFQAVLMAHGGLTTLGANAFSMAIVGPWVAFGAFMVTRKLTGNLLAGAFVAAVLSDLATYTVTAVQLGLAKPGPDGDVLAGIGKFLALFGPTQVPLAIVEGLVTVLIVRALSSVALPDLTRLGVLSPAAAATADARTSDQPTVTTGADR